MEEKGHAGGASEDTRNGPRPTREEAVRIANLERAEQALAAAIIAHADDAIISKALDGTVLSWNRGAESMFGYAAAEMLGKPITRLFPAERMHEEAQLIAQILKGREISHFVTQRLRKNGARFDVSVTLSPVMDAQNRVVAVSKIARDLTQAYERKRQDAFAAAIIADSDDAIVAKTLDGTVLSWNKAASVMFGYTAQEMIGHSITRLFPADRQHEEARFIEQILQGLDVRHFQTERICKDGSLIHVSVTLSPIHDENGEVVAISKIARNITDQVRMQAELDRLTSDLYEQHERMRVTLASIGDGVVTTDTEGIIQWLNPVASRLTGWSLEDAQGQSADCVLNFIHDETRLKAPCPVAESLSIEQIVGLAPHSVLIAKDGAERAIEDSAAPIRNDSGTVLGSVLVFHDVSEQRRLSKEVSHRASHDALTGLLNRTEFEARLNGAFESARGGGLMHVLMYIDLDQFKIVNDICGHAVGDRMLKEVASLLRSAAGRDDVLARLGGDEFGVLLENCSLPQARRVGQNVCDQMERFRFVHEDKRFRVGTSIGVVPIDDRWATATELMVAADAACYAAKDNGRNRVHEWVDSDATMVERHGEMRWASRIQQAMDDKRFKLYGQRIGSCAGAESAGHHFEVLLRLIDQAGSLVLPGVFLPAAERFDMASRLDRWVLCETLGWMLEQNADDLATVAVNLSGQSLGDRSFHRYAAKLIESMAHDPSKICLEITETAAITHLGDAIEFIGRMRNLGVRIALDDFGAGVSSFGYLKSLPVDILKIDGQFVRNILVNRLDRTAVCCFRDIAAVCGLGTVAEFVESEPILTELKQIGIDYAQGYILHRPEPLEALVGRGSVNR